MGITKNIDKEMYVKMKSRNLKAIFASVLTVALLATAMTGFAANVATTTIYNTGYDKVEVTTTVTNATDNSEVTYLVKSGSDIVYIDQDTAEGGTVQFVYKIAKEKIEEYSSDVTFGTNADDSFDGDTGTLGIVGLTDVVAETYTITYVEDAAVLGEEVTVNITVADNYEITDIIVGDESKGSDNTTFKVAYGTSIDVKTKEAEKTPAISVYKDLDGTTFTAVIIPDGNIDEFGIQYALFNDKDGNPITKLYKSLEKDMSKPAAVQLILPEDKAEVPLDGFKPYFKVDDEISNVYTEYNNAG